MSYSYDINHLCDITNTECSSKGSEMQSTSRTAQRPPEPTLVCFWTGALPGTLKCSCTEAKIQPRQAQWRGFWAHPWPGNGELQGPCGRSPKRRGSLRCLPPLALATRMGT